MPNPTERLPLAPTLPWPPPSQPSEDRLIAEDKARKEATRRWVAEFMRTHAQAPEIPGIEVQAERLHPRGSLPELRARVEGEPPGPPGAEFVRGLASQAVGLGEMGATGLGLAFGVPEAYDAAGQMIEGLPRMPGEIVRQVRENPARAAGEMVDIPGAAPALGMVALGGRKRLRKLLTSERPALPKARTTGRKVAQHFGYERLSLAPVEEAGVRQTLGALGMDTRRVRSFDDMRTAAGEFGLSPEMLVTGVAEHTLADVQVVGLADQIKRESATLRDLHRQIAAGVDVEANTRRAASSERAIQDALGRLVPGLTESARAVTAARIMARDTLDPTYWYVVAQRTLAKSAKGKGMPPLPATVRQAIDEAIQAQDRAALAQIIGRLHDPGWTEKVLTLWRAGMLTNPATDAANLTGNVVMAGLENVASLHAGVLDYLYSLATGKPRARLVPSRREMAAQAKGLGVGARKAGEYLRTGVSEADLASKYDFNRNWSFNNPALDFYKAAVFRRLGAEDELFRNPAHFGTVAELAELEAKRLGLTGKRFLAHIRRRVRRPTPEMLEIANGVADYRTFQGDSRLARFAASAGPVGKIIMPFQRTPINIGAAILDYSPLGLPKAALTAARKEFGSEALQRRYWLDSMGRAATGTELIALGWYIASTGRAVGGRPADTQVREQRRMLGVPDYGVKTGPETWVQVSRISPAANLFMAGVELAEQAGSSDRFHEAATNATLGLWQTYKDQGFLRGVSAASDALANPKQMGSTFVETLAASVVPSLVGAIARGSDPNQREIGNPLEAIMARLPGLRQKLEPRRTVTGTEVPSRVGLPEALLSPVTVDRTTEVPVDRLLAETYVPGRPKGVLTVRGTRYRLEGDDAKAFQRDVERERRSVLERMGPAGPPGSDEERAKRVRAAMEAATDRVADRWRAKISRGEAKARELKRNPAGRISQEDR